MKTRLFVLLAVFVISINSFAQEKKEKDQKSITPPIAVKSAFQKAYPGVSREKWGKEDADYEVSFKQNNKDMSLVYDRNGTLKETETTIKVSELPVVITDYVKQHYKGAAIHEAAKIIRPNGEVNYEAEVNKTDLLFDAKGGFLKAQKD